MTKQKSSIDKCIFKIDILRMVNYCIEYLNQEYMANLEQIHSVKRNHIYVLKVKKNYNQ